MGTVGLRNHGSSLERRCWSIRGVLDLSRTDCGVGSGVLDGSDLEDAGFPVEPHPRQPTADHDDQPQLVTCEPVERQCITANAALLSRLK